MDVLNDAQLGFDVMENVNASVSSFVVVGVKVNDCPSFAVKVDGVLIVGDDGKDMPVGESGELWVKGPQVMKGYFNRDDETAKCMTDGWFATGDVAKCDEEGFFFIVDRKKDMIIVSGFNVYPNEIEEVVAMHEGILEVAAVGVPHEVSGEQVKIFVVKKDPLLTEKDIIKHCRENLTNYKVPKFVEFKDELPKTNVGKILRRALKEAS